ncbi:MAG TPA: glycosyltransferase family 2 protein, partial [Acetobacteraceae bacterium]|nr:glycosyltransferase family 2 protein [Acetobacteraceae bacterium]
MGNHGQRKAVCCIIKNEEWDISEWIAHYINLGFDFIVIYNNSSNDRTDEIVALFGHIADVRLVNWPISDARYQNKAYLDAMKRFGPECDWFLFVDSDELFVPLVDNWHQWLSEFDQDVGQILVNWTAFGASNHEKFHSGLVVDSFVHRCSEDEDGHVYTKPFVRP